MPKSCKKFEPRLGASTGHKDCLHSMNCGRRRRSTDSAKTRHVDVNTCRIPGAGFRCILTHATFLHANAGGDTSVGSQIVRLDVFAPRYDANDRLIDHRSKAVPDPFESRYVGIIGQRNRDA